jgi:hypothetical protein
MLLFNKREIYFDRGDYYYENSKLTKRKDTKEKSIKFFERKRKRNKDEKAPGFVI